MANISTSNCILCYAKVTFVTNIAAQPNGRKFVLDQYWSPCKCDGDPLVPNAISAWAKETSVTA